MSAAPNSSSLVGEMAPPQLPRQRGGRSGSTAHLLDLLVELQLQPREVRVHQGLQHKEPCSGPAPSGPAPLKPRPGSGPAPLRPQLRQREAACTAVRPK